MKIQRAEVRWLVALSALGLVAAGPGCAEQPRPGDEQARPSDTRPDEPRQGEAQEQDTAACTARQGYSGHATDCTQEETAFLAQCSAFCGPTCTYNWIGTCIPNATSQNNYSYICDCAPAHPPATQMVNGGEVSQSQHYQVVHTLGQPTINQGATTSTSYRIQGGLIGANGSLP
jgi:hypothetical protein